MAFDPPPVLQSFIGGAFVGSASDTVVADVNPSDARDVVAEIPGGDPRDVERAVEAAESALQPWKALTGPARAEHLFRWADVLSARREELALAMAREIGKPISEARGEVARGTVILRYSAGDAVRAVGEVVPAQAPQALQYFVREPLGVVALITPWNFPLAIPLWKAAPALAFGNTVVLKPAETSSRMAVLLAETAKDAGLPPGVFNVILGSGAAIGGALLGAGPVRAVSFTGSAAVGARVAAAAASRNIRFQTEMGGKNAVIVAEDADIDRAAALTAAGAMRFAGQKCTATSRAIVVRSVADRFVDAVLEKISTLPLGPVEDPAAAVGPLISRDSRDAILHDLGAAGGERVCGGTPPTQEAFSRGFFLLPTVIRGVSPDAELARKELFGPVLAVILAEDLDEAVTIANDSAYGLSASLFTRELKRAIEYIPKIEAGLVRINGDTTGVDPHAPFGGTKGSSSGSREQGSAAREFYTEIKTVQIHP
jgi:acyl-CoA reductase-like NAD-dependent aldehyde dehydrogenase